MAKSGDIERRILNWVRWKAGGGGMLGYAGVNWGAEGGGGGGYREAVVPTSDQEAAETDAAIAALPLHLRETVLVHYVEGARSGLAWQAQLLGVSISTLHARVDDLHRRIGVWLVERHAARREERERVEALHGRVAPRLRSVVVGT